MNKVEMLRFEGLYSNAQYHYFCGNSFSSCKKDKVLDYCLEIKLEQGFNAIPNRDTNSIGIGVDLF